MTRVCADVENDKYETLFSSAQCTGYHREKPLTVAMCNPPRAEIVDKLKHHIRNINAKAVRRYMDYD